MAFRDNLTAPDFLPLKVGRIGCPETSVRSYHCLPRNWPEERSSYLLLDGNMKLRMHNLLAVREINFLRSWEQSCANRMNEEKEEAEKNKMRIWRNNMEVEIKQ